MQNHHFGSKMTIPKTCQQPFCKSFRVVLCKKTARKNTKYLRNETILRIGHHVRAIAHAKPSLWVKNYKSKKHVKIHFKNHLEFCVKNRSKKKNTKYSRNETILKIGNDARAISMQTPHFGSKTKIPKIMSKSNLKII